MKYLKLFESQNIEEICKKYNIENYHINSDGTVDVHGNVSLYDKRLDKIPLNFGNVSGYFSFERNKLKNLIGCPKRVGGFFSCGNNNLTSLEGAPTYIGSTFWCQNNPNLWSMDHFPRHAKIVWLIGTPINTVFYLFKDALLSFRDFSICSSVNLSFSLFFNCSCEGIKPNFKPVENK